MTFPEPFAVERGTVGPRPAAGSNGVLLSLVAGLVILALAAGGAWWYFVHRKGAPPAAAPSASVDTKPANPPAGAVSETDKPSAFSVPPTAAPASGSHGAGSSRQPPAAVQRPPAEPAKPAEPPAPAHAPAAEAPAPVPAVSNAVPAPPAPPPALAPTPAAPRSGVLRYSGPPVPQNGQVVFENLPNARLKFTFDQQAWQPLIRRQPNGTQTLTMRSLLPGMQSQCEVRWEIVP